MEVKYCNLSVTLKKIENENSDIKENFNSRVAFTEIIKKDRSIFIKFA